MNFARLLTAGKSLVGLREIGPRYRVNKNVRLPRFISPKNPFALANEAKAKHPIAKLPKSAIKVETVPAEKKAVVATAKLDRTVSGIRNFGLTVGAGAIGLVSDWGRKLSPFVRRKEPRAAVRSAANARTPAPLQGELSLDRVKVMRNDLSDTDFELRQPTKLMAMPKVAAAMAEKLEPVGAAWNRLTTRFFGDDQT